MDTTVAAAAASLATALREEASALLAAADLRAAADLGVGLTPTPEEEALRRLQYRRMAAVLSSVASLAETEEGLWSLRKCARMGVMTSSRLGGSHAVSSLLRLVFDDDE